MSLLFIDGFDHYTALTEKYDIVTVPPLEAEIDINEGRFTNGSLELALGNTGAITKFITESNELIVGLALKFTGNNLWTIKFLDSSGNIIITFEAAFTGAKVWRGLHDSGTLLGEFDGAFTTSTWQYLEVRIKRHPTLGEVEVRVGEMVVLALVNQNTGAADFSRIGLQPSVQDIAGSLLLDDLYILNTEGAAPQNTFIGDVRVTALRPKANGNTNNFTPTGAADNFGAVNEELADQDTTFVEAGQLGAKEDYDNTNFVDLGISPGTIYGVQVVNSAKKTDAGTLRYKDQMVIAGTIFSGVEVTATAVDYKMTTFIRDTDPSDDAAWTESKVAATGSGYEITFREV